MRLAPRDFWRTTLAEWRVMLDALADDEEKGMRKRAWAVSHLMVAAGCKPEHVSIGRLLGEKESRRREIDPETRARRDAARIFKVLEQRKAANG